MKLLLTLLLAGLPAAAKDSKPVPQDFPVPMETAVRNFEDDVADASAKIRQLMAESRLKGYGWQINYAIAQHDPETAQKALDNMIREFPEIKKEEPHAIEYHQGLIYFWRKDFDAAYKGFDKIINALELKYPNGIPPGSKYYSVNTSFMAEAYFNRGATEMQLRAFARAVVDIDKAFALMPKAYMQVNKCRALLPLKKYKEAAAAYELAYKIDSKWAKSAEDRPRMCEALLKNGFQPKPCLKTGTETDK